MAISFTRPDPSSASAVASAAFTTSRKGFDQAEVREFLRMVAAELARLQEREKFLERELRTMQRGPTSTSVALDEEVVTRMLGEEAARILHTARDAANQIRTRAEDGAARLLREASDEAHRLRTEAELEASRRRNDAAADAESELEMAKQQGREMVNEARSYRERVLSELARRREMARQQIEQLIHGRDRLLQAFERSRAVAVDVMAELTPLGEPTEYVDLSPTTGPVPIIVPRRPLHIAERPAQAEPAVVDDAGEEVLDDTSSESDETTDIEPIRLELVSDDAASDAIVLEITRPADDDERVEDSADESSASVVASVIELFGPDEPPAAVDERAPDEGTAIDLASENDATATADRGAVEDLFARLRASRADLVAQRVVDTAPPTELPVDDHTDEHVPTVAIEQSVEASASEDSVFLATPEAPAAEVSVDDTPFARRDAALTPVIVAAARKLKRVLADEQNEVLHALRRRDPVRSIDAIVTPEAEHIGRYVAAIDTELTEAAVAGAESMGASASAAKKDVKRTQAAKPAGVALGVELVTPLRDRLARCIGDADGDNGELANLVRILYREWKNQRIDEHLDDVVRTAFGRGALAAAGDGAPIKWIVDPHGPACPDAEDNALAGTVSAGERFPTDHVCAPAHSGCTCMIARATT